MSLEINTKTTGFGSPAENYVEKRLDLNNLIVSDPITTYYFRYVGESKFNINENDILVVDRAITPNIGDIVLIKTNKIVLETYNNQLNLWGVVTWSLSNKFRI